MQHMLKGMDVEILVTLVADEVMTVALVVAHKEVLAVGSLDILPISKAILYGEDCRMIVDLARNRMLL